MHFAYTYCLRYIIKFDIIHLYILTPETTGNDKQTPLSSGWRRAASFVGIKVGSNVGSNPNFAKIKTCEASVYRRSQVF